MSKLNAEVEIDKKTFAEVAATHLGNNPTKPKLFGPKLWKLTKEHAVLVFVSVFFAVLLALPLGILAYRSKLVAQPVLLGTGVLQTIPSLALLCFLIPVFGIGTTPALVALFLYALLPIVRNSYLGFQEIDPALLESARALGLGRWRTLWEIELPLALPSIMAGIKMSAVINVGTATLAALIGAGGYGVPIITGLAINNYAMIYEGAVPAALFAILVSLLFEGLEYFLVSPGLRKN